MWNRELCMTSVTGRLRKREPRRLPLPPQMKGYMRNAMDVMMK